MHFKKFINEFNFNSIRSCNTQTAYAFPHSSQAKVSVVISFFNEARSVLLRTIVTLIRRTSLDYLHELIVIDDCSDDGRPKIMTILTV